MSLHPLFSGIVEDFKAASKSYVFPPSQYAEPRPRGFGSRSGLGDGCKVCPFCGINHDSAHRYCDYKCAALDNGDGT